MVKYEDELDLLAIVDVSNAEDVGQANVRLHHNKNGALLKKIALQEPWDVVGITLCSFSPSPPLFFRAVFTTKLLLFLDLQS